MTHDVDANPLAKLTNVIILDSLKRGASEIHIEPYEKDYHVRLRINGTLSNVMALPVKLKDALTARIKSMAKMDVAERRLAQQGRIKIKLTTKNQSRDVDFRVTCRPTLWGEKIVLQLLDGPKSARTR